LSNTWAHVLIAHVEEVEHEIAQVGNQIPVAAQRLIVALAAILLVALIVDCELMGRRRPVTQAEKSAVLREGRVVIRSPKTSERNPRTA